MDIDLFINLISLVNNFVRSAMQQKLCKLKIFNSIVDQYFENEGIFTSSKYLNNNKNDKI